MEPWIAGVAVMVFGAVWFEILRRVTVKVTRDELRRGGVSDEELRQRGLL